MNSLGSTKFKFQVEQGEVEGKLAFGSRHSGSLNQSQEKRVFGGANEDAEAACVRWVVIKIIKCGKK